MLVDTHASKNDKTPHESYSLKEAAKLPVYIISLVKW